MNWSDILIYVLPMTILLVVVIVNFINRSYEIIGVNKDYLAISRLYMSERPFYKEDIHSITLKELKNGKSKVVIKSKNKKLNIPNMIPNEYEKLVDFSKVNGIDFYLENITGKREKINK